MAWNLVSLVSALALLELMLFGLMTGRARFKYGIDAPATTGNPIFERYFRVQQNTLEQMFIFLPALWIFAWYASVQWAVAIGLVFIVARIFYMRGYLIEPRRRLVAAGITVLVNGVLIAGGLAGLLVKVL